MLNATGTEVVVNKINITSEELAIKHRFPFAYDPRERPRHQMEVRSM